MPPPSALTKLALRPLLRIGRSQLSTSQTARFKFKLTDEMSQEFDEMEAKKQPKEAPQAEHTRESSLIMGRVSHDRYRNIIKCAIPKHRFNDFLMMYRRENDDVQAIDDNGVTHPGDWVLLRRDESITDPAVRHRVERVVYLYGHYVDPMTNKRSMGLFFEDDWERLEQIKLDI